MTGELDFFCSNKKYCFYTELKLFTKLFCVEVSVRGRCPELVQDSEERRWQL